MAKKQSRRSISVRGVTYNQLREHCSREYISISDFLEQRIADYFATNQVVFTMPGTEYKVPARPVPKPAPRPLKLPEAAAVARPVRAVSPEKAAPPAAVAPVKPVRSAPEKVASSAPIGTVKPVRSAPEKAAPPAPVARLAEVVELKPARAASVETPPRGREIPESSTIVARNTPAVAARRAVAPAPVTQKAEPVNRSTVGRPGPTPASEVLREQRPAGSPDGEGKGDYRSIRF